MSLQKITTEITSDRWPNYYSFDIDREGLLSISANWNTGILN